MQPTAIHGSKQSKKLTKAQRTGRLANATARYVFEDIRPMVQELRFDHTVRFEAMEEILGWLDERWYRRLWRAVTRRPGLKQRYATWLQLRAKVHQEAAEARATAEQKEGQSDGGSDQQRSA